MICIGIDPDLTQTGLAVAEQGKVKELHNFDILGLHDFLKENKDQIKKVYLEAGWLNQKTSWHAQNTQKRGVVERTAYHIGQNHAVGKLIEQMLKGMGINYVLIKPWESKRNHAEFCRWTGWTGGRTNQETRDAGCLVHGHF